MCHFWVWKIKHNHILQECDFTPNPLPLHKFDMLLPQRRSTDWYTWAASLVCVYLLLCAFLRLLHLKISFVPAYVAILCFRIVYVTEFFLTCLVIPPLSLAAVGTPPLSFYVVARACFSVYIAALLHWTSLPNCKFWLRHARGEVKEAVRKNMEGGEKEKAVGQKQENKVTVSADVYHHYPKKAVRGTASVWVVLNLTR